MINGPVPGEDLEIIKGIHSYLQQGSLGYEYVYIRLASGAHIYE